MKITRWPTLSLVALTTILILTRPTAASEPNENSERNDVLIVSRNIVAHNMEPFQILERDLLANDGSGAAFHSFTPTSRGRLETASGKLIYTPESEFWDVGMDSFSYVFDASGDSARVFLIADRLEGPSLAIDADLEVTHSPRTVVFREGAIRAEFRWRLLLRATDNTLLASWSGTERQRVEQSPPSDSGGGKIGGDIDVSALLMHADEEQSPPSDSGGGKIGGDIDVSALMMHAGDELTLAKYSIEDSRQIESNIELKLTFDGTRYLVAARSYQNDSTVFETDFVALEEGITAVAARWWWASFEGARDGVVALEIDRRVAATRSDVGYGPLMPGDQSVRASFASLEGLLPVDGLIYLDNLKLRQGIYPRMPLHPIFADDLESSDLSAWAQVVGTVDVTSDAALYGNWGLEVGPSSAAYVIDRTPTNEPHYRARFTVKTENLDLAENSELTVLRGIDLPGGPRPFSVRLRQEPGGHSLCAYARTIDGTLRSTDCCELTSMETNRVEIRWWSATSGAEQKGRFELDVNKTSPLTPVCQIENLSNGHLSISEVHFGAAKPAPGTGTLYLDNFESWR